MITNKNLTKQKDFTKKFQADIIQDTILTLLIFAIILIIISNPTKYTYGTISGLKLFFFNVLPGLFPFMFLTKLITEIGLIFNVSQKLNKFSYKIFGTPGVSIYAFIMSIISGYPIGAKIISDLYLKQQITEDEAKKMSVFCTTSGPIFIIGTVGSIMFKSIKYGIILYFSHIISSIILGVTFNFFSSKKISKQVNQKFVIKYEKQSNIINTCVTQTINSLFIVGAYITLFYLLSDILESLNIFNFLTKILSPALSKFGFNISHIKGSIYGVLEVTRGAKELSVISDKSAIAITSGILSFSGLSIIMQSMAFLKDAKIKAHNFVFAKCVHMFVSMAICYILLIIV